MKIYGDERLEVILKELGGRIKDIRIKRDMTQKDLAENAGVSFSTVVRVEMGEGVNMENFMRIIRVFDFLGNFDLLVPEQILSPEDIYKGRQKKKRTYKGKKSAFTEWIWEDEKK